MSQVAFVRSVADGIQAGGLFARNEVLVVGVSGGPDSMALLHALVELNGEFGYELSIHIAHLNHELRGTEAEKDAAFVQGAADNLQLPCTIERRDVGALAGAGEGSMEEVARQERYAFLERTCRAVGAKVAAVGHQRDDDAETILHRILRGTGLRGLTGIPFSRAISEGSSIRLVRPLLRRDRQSILAYLSSAGVPYREDRTNDDSSRATRNRIRNVLLPLLEAEINPQVRDALLRLGVQARWLADYFTETAARTFETLVISRTDQELVLNAAALNRKPRIIQAEVIRRAVVAFELGEQDLGFAQMVAVLDLVSDPASGKEAHLPGGMNVTKRYDRLVFSLPTDEPRESIATEIAVHVPGRTVLPVRRLEINCTSVDLDSPTLALWRERQHAVSDSPAAATGGRGSVDEEWVDLDRVHQPLVVRTRSPGDRFWPLGAPGSKKLSEFLSDAKVDPDERGRVAVLCDRLGPIWVIGHRIDERVKLTPGSRRALQLRARRVES